MIQDGVAHDPKLLQLVGAHGFVTTDASGGSLIVPNRVIPSLLKFVGIGDGLSVPESFLRSDVAKVAGALISGITGTTIALKDKKIPVSTYFGPLIAEQIRK